MFALALMTAALAFDGGDWRRPRSLGHFFGEGDMTDAAFIDGAWVQGKDDRRDGHAFYRSTDLVRWQRVSRFLPYLPSSKVFSGDTGGLALDDDGTPVVIYPGGGGISAAVATDRSLTTWKSLGKVINAQQQVPWLTHHCDPSLGQGAGYELMDVPTPFKGERDGLWHLVTSVQGCEDRARGRPDNPSGNQAQALLFTSPTLQTTNWTYAGVYFKTNETVIPGRTGWVDTIDADTFRGVRGAANASVTVFVNGWAGGPTANNGTEQGGLPTGTVWNQEQYWIGRTLPNGSFVPFRGVGNGRVATGAVDYGNYMPVPRTANNSMGLDVAGLGGTQYYTCKAGQDLTAGYDKPGRRIMFSWLLEGLTGAFPGTSMKNISVRSLPRDVTLSYDEKKDEHELLQAPVPELKVLRLAAGRLPKTTLTLSAAAGQEVLHPLPFASLQFELVATFTYSETPALDFVGVRFAANSSILPQTAFAAAGISRPHDGDNYGRRPPLAVLDRQRSFFRDFHKPAVPNGPLYMGDIRAGPLPVLTSRADGGTEQTTHRMHLFVDHCTTETFVDNRTIVSAHIWPPNFGSNRTVLHLRCGAAACSVQVEVEAWQLTSTEPDDEEETASAGESLKTDDVDDDGSRGRCNDYRCDGTCTDATDCSLGGLCVKGKCVCDATFTGPNCVALNLDLATRGPAWNAPSGEKRNGSWGGNVVLDASGKFHLFYAEFVGQCGLDSWGTNSEVSHAVASSPQGPYAKQQEAVLPVFHHNPTVVYENSSKTFLLFSIGNLSSTPPQNCSQGQHAQLQAAGRVGDPPAAGIITLSHSLSASGPWAALPAPVLAGRPGKWDAFVTNPSVQLFANGTALLAYRGGAVNPVSHNIGIAAATVTELLRGETFRRLPEVEDQPLFPSAGSNEDPGLFTDARGHFHMLTHYMEGRKGPGGHAFSTDGRNWTFAGQAYDLWLRYSDGKSTRVARRERPQVLSLGGKPSYLFTGVDPHGGLPWTQVQPIKTKTDDAVAITAHIGCTDEWDCSLAGSCGSDGLCLCDSGWQGPTCAMVAFDAAPSIGHAFRPGHGFTTWGGSPIQADNHSMYYLFASVNVHGTLSDWWNTSVIVTATSTSAAGPYYWDRKTVTIGPKINSHVRPSKHVNTHRWDSIAVQNPVVVRLKKGAGFVLYYAGSNLTTPHYGMNNSAIMAAYATSLDGPWETSEQPVLVPFTSPESWEAGSVCNPAAHVHDDNSVTLAYRGYWDNNGIAFAWAPSWRGPFRRLYGGSGLFAERPTLEDPFLLSSPRGFHVLMHYFKADNCSNAAGGRQCALVGNHAFSRAAPRPSADAASGADGADTEFFLAPNRGAAAGGYDLGVEFANGTAARLSHREEPKMLLEWSEAAGDYVPTHLFNVVVEQQKAPSDGWAHLESYIFTQPLKAKTDDDLAWVEQPQAWHQQAVRIVDHPFSSLAELREFGLQAKKAGVSVVQLVGPQKTKRCVGVWCGGVGLCDHINGSFPADDPTATLAEWQHMLKEIRPVRLMWWANFAYWSSQGEVAEQAMADPTSDVGRFFSYGPNASAFPVCPGKWLGNSSDPKAGSWGYSNPCFKDRRSGRQLCAQGSWGSVAGDCNRTGVSNTSACFNDKLDGCSKATMDRFGRCIPSFNANLAHKEYVDYLADALANSWSRNLGIDGYIVDTSLQVPCAPGINPKYGEPGGSEHIFYNDIIGRVRETQPQVVLSGEDCSGWDDAIAHNFQLPGTKAAGHVLAMQAAVEAMDLDTIESVVASSGADAAAVICYLHPGLDGKPSGACPTLYYRDTFASYSVHNASAYRLWVALEAASGILTEHQHSPTAVFGQGYGSWNVSADPYIDDDKESPLWAFVRSRALNRLALRTKLTLTSAVERSSLELANYTLYADANCYKGHGGVVLPGHTTQRTAAACAALCTADEKCDCVMYQARKGDAAQSKSWRSCWKRAACEPLKFERDNLTQVYDCHVKRTVAPSRSSGAIAYLKHDALGPRGDAAVVVFNPGAAQTLTVDLSSLPPSVLGGKVLPVDLFTNATAASPLSKSWSVKMASGSFAAFGFRGLGVFAPRKGKSGPCNSGYSKLSAAATLQACFLDCAHDPKCKNAFVEAKALPKWLEKPGPISCTLLGAVAAPKSACTSGNGTLIAALPGARPMAVKTDDIGRGMIYRNSTVFTYGEKDSNGKVHKCYRGPSIHQLKSGALLAFASAGGATDCDNGNISIVTRKSVDGGLTWQPILVAAFKEGQALVYTAPTVDAAGTVHVLYTENDNSAWTSSSSDEGATWSAPLNVTAVLEPRRPSTGNWFAPGPSGGIQIGGAGGPLLVGVRGPFGEQGRDSMAAVLFDNATWRRGARLPIAGQEPSVTNFNGGVAVVARSGGGVFGLAFSNSSAQHWTASKPVNLTGSFCPASCPPGCTCCTTPDCQGAVLGVGPRLLLSAPSATDTKGRSGLKVFSSADSGASWQVLRTLTSDNWSTGYSSFVLLRGGKSEEVGCLFESRNCQSPLLCKMGINFALFSAMKTDDADEASSSYKLYNPTIEYSDVVSPQSSPLQYNHDASIALFKGVWIAVWNANTIPKEGQAGQFNMMSTSRNRLNWTSPVRAFSDPAHASNPVPCNASTCTQWQPNLFLLGGKLRCVWSGSNGRAGRVDGNAMNTFFSTLSAPTGKWINQPIVFNSSVIPSRTKPFFQGANWTLFASQNPTVLDDGRILAPVVMTSSRFAADCNPGCHLHPVPHNVSQMCFERRSSVLVSDNEGESWHASQGTVIPTATWAQWEPTVWAPTGSDVFMVSRYNDFRLTADGGPRADERMQRSTSSDKGETWTPLEPLPLDTVTSRMQVMAQRKANGDGTARFLMVMNDFNPFNIRGTAGRLNVALYLAPVGLPDIASFAFAPGVGLSSAHEIAMYPQMFQDAKTLAVIWSSGDVPRGIKVASLSLPPEGKTVSIRNNSDFQDARPEVVESKWLRFYGQERLQTASPIKLKPLGRVVSAGCWLRIGPTLGRSGTLLDTRGAPKGGLIMGLKAQPCNWSKSAPYDRLLAPYIWLGPTASAGASTNVELPANSALVRFCTESVHAGYAVYFGFSVNASLGHAQFFCAADGRIEEEGVHFNSSASFGTTSWPAAAIHSNATVGFKNEPFCARSSITGLIADLGSFALLGGRMLTSRMHAALANVHAQSLGLPVIENASGWIPNAAEFAMRLDAQAALLRQFPLPLSTSSEKPSVDGQLLRLCQNTSASVELPPVTCVAAGPGLQASVKFRLQPAAAGGEAFTILTVGGGEAHARLIGEAVVGTANRTFALRLMCSASTSSTIVAASVALDEWITLNITSMAGSISANGSAAVQCGCRSKGPIWAFLGEGFLDRRYAYSSGCVQHDISALQAHPAQKT